MTKRNKLEITDLIMLMYYVKDDPCLRYLAKGGMKSFKAKVKEFTGTSCIHI